MKSWLVTKDPNAGKDWGQEEKGPTEDEMAGWHHRLNGHEFGWTPGVGDGQGGLACCSPWSHKELDTNERLNWTTKCQALFFYFQVTREWRKPSTWPLFSSSTPWYFKKCYKKARLRAGKTTDSVRSSYAQEMGDFAEQQILKIDPWKITRL